MTVTVSDTMHARITDMAQDTGLTKSHVVRIALALVSWENVLEIIEEPADPLGE